MDDARVPPAVRWGRQWGYHAHLDDPGGESPTMSEAHDPTVSEAPLPQSKPEGKQPERPAPDKPAEAKDEKAEKPPTPLWRKLLYWAIGLIILGALLTTVVLYYLDSRHYETTDDAFVDGHIAQVSAQVGGRVISLAVQDNQQVKAGAPILALDPRDLQSRLEQARAQRVQAGSQAAQARAQLGLQQANIDQAAAQVRVTEADLAQAISDLARYRAVDPKAITRQQVDTASATTRSAQAKLDANRQAVVGARAQLSAQQAQVGSAEANIHIADVAIANAELQLSYATVVAPQDGRVTRRTVEVGNYVNPGQALLAVVGTDLWITANYKETQLADMRVGQPVRVQVDACPKLDLSAKIDSFQSGSGNAFSSLPAENATGNYVKVVQRVPVKIVFTDDGIGQCQMAPGMSVSPRVTVRP